ncbi:MAG: hypothetical protein HY647_10340 [Acidobacteria bacterium]|nr:hypothetical protein [Acidobacteriota bacterium]
MSHGSFPSGGSSPRETVSRANPAGTETHGAQLETLIQQAAGTAEPGCRKAQETLDCLPDEQCLQALADPSLPELVARYFLDRAHVRPSLLPLLLSHPAVPQEAITTLAATAGPELIPALLEHLDLLKTTALVALKNNPAYQAWQQKPPSGVAELAKEEKLTLAQQTKEIRHPEQLSVLVALASDLDEEVSLAAQTTLRHLPDEQYVEALMAPSLEDSVARYFLDPVWARPSLLPILLAHSSAPQDAITALAATAGPELVPVLLDQLDLLRTPALVALKDNPAYLHWQQEPTSGGVVLEVDLLQMLIEEMETAGAQPTWDEEAVLEEEAKAPTPKLGLVRKIAKMSVAQRVKLALMGSREERGLLIRDPSKVVTRAVLSSPKLTEGEVESFAAMKNVTQDVLRLISMNRKFMKNYTILKSLASNARLPIDIGLTLLNRLIPNDLRAVAGSKEVPDTTRKMAEKLYKSRQGKQG